MGYTCRCPDCTLSVKVGDTQFILAETVYIGTQRYSGTIVMFSPCWNDCYVCSHSVAQYCRVCCVGVPTVSLLP